MVGEIVDRIDLFKSNSEGRDFMDLVFYFIFSVFGFWLYLFFDLGEGGVMGIGRCKLVRNFWEVFWWIFCGW